MSSHDSKAKRVKHIPVLLQETLEKLNLKEGDIFVDATLGSAGHSLPIAERFGDDVEIIGLDADSEALERSEERLRTLSHSIFLRNENFRNLDQVLEGLGISQVNGVLFDLGISSEELEDSGRGFTFQKNEPLDMRMSKRGLKAEEILNTWDEDTLEIILRGFGEERFSKRIAREIVQRREKKPLKTTYDLVEVVKAVYGKKKSKINPATKTFQAIRIAVNEELVSLEEGLSKAWKALGSKGRIAVITFHSLEDRIVKNFFRDLVKSGEGLLVLKKPLTPTPEEIKKNPRSRSAKLRVIEKA